MYKISLRGTNDRSLVICTLHADVMASNIWTFSFLVVDERTEKCTFRDEEDDCTYHYTVEAVGSVLANYTVLVQKKKG